MPGTHHAGRDMPGANHAGHESCRTQIRSHDQLAAASNGNLS